MLEQHLLNHQQHIRQHRQLERPLIGMHGRYGNQPPCTEEPLGRDVQASGVLGSVMVLKVCVAPRWRPPQRKHASLPSLAGFRVF